jgi:Nuclease-related domain.
VITINYKDSTNEVLLDYYKENGFQKTVDVAKSMYNVNLKNAKKNFKTDMNGEVCETVLEIGILEFMKRYPKACEHWVLKKGLIIKDIEDPNNGFMTEIDLVLATPQMIYLFECKSYTG